MGALVALNQEALSDEVIQDTLGVLLKYHDDIQLVEQLGLRHLLARALTTI
jgi:hypothetical protein